MATAAAEHPATMMPEQKQQPIDFWEAVKVRRTRAMPKNTLFGSSLEAFDEEDRENIKKIDPNTQKIPHEMKPGRFQLPESLRAQLPAHRIVERSRKEVENQQKALDTARSHLSTLEREALLFNENQNQNGRQSQQYMNKQAMNVFKDMNDVGLSENNSYNRDKYRQRAPVHKYSLMGDVLRNGNEVYRREQTEIPKFNRNSIDTSQPNVALVRHASAREQRSSEGAVRLPPNIRHQFGSRVCDSLLSDKKVVEKTMKDQERMKEILQRKSTKVTIPKMDQTLNPEYESLGNAMRMNVFPGYTINHKISTMKDTFTDSVFLKRYHDPDQWRMQRDELSTWAEHNVLQQRMKKAWEEYFLETLAKKAQKA